MADTTRRDVLALGLAMGAAFAVPASANDNGSISPELADLFATRERMYAGARVLNDRIEALAKNGTPSRDIRQIEDECTDRFYDPAWDTEVSILSFEPRSFADIEAQLRLFAKVQDEQADFANLIADAVRRLAGA
jgi:hypothetical protein